MTNLPNYIKYSGYGFPRRIFYKKVAGPEISKIQLSDAVFDEYDYKIRKIEISTELKLMIKEDRFYRNKAKMYD